MSGPPPLQQLQVGRGDRTELQVHQLAVSPQLVVGGRGLAGLHLPAPAVAHPGQQNPVQSAQRGLPVPESAQAQSGPDKRHISSEHSLNTQISTSYYCGVSANPVVQTAQVRALLDSVHQLSQQVHPALQCSRQTVFNSSQMEKACITFMAANFTVD